MKRFMALGILVIAMAAPVAAQEEIKAVDHLTNKESQVKGAIDSESPEGIKIKVGNEAKLVPALDVKFVQYRLKDVKGYEYNLPFAKETKALDPTTKPADRLKLLAEARAEFETLGPRLSGMPNAERYIQFKVAQVAALQAKDDPTQLEPAIKLLQEYKTVQDKGWELVPALRLLAQLQEDKGDFAAARQTYMELGKVPNLAKETKLEADLLGAQLSARTGKFDDAEKVLNELRTSLGPNDPQRGAALVCLAQVQLAQGKLNDVEAHIKGGLAATSDAAVRAKAHNTLGDYYRKRNQNEDAFWEYLRVDAMYAEDRSEHAKALYYLSKLFVEVKKDKVKSVEALEKLKLLEGTEYAKVAAAEK